MHTARPSCLITSYELVACCYYAGPTYLREAHAGIIRNTLSLPVQIGLLSMYVPADH